MTMGVLRLLLLLLYHGDIVPLDHSSSMMYNDKNDSDNDRPIVCLGDKADGRHIYTSSD